MLRVKHGGQLILKMGNYDAVAKLLDEAAPYNSQHTILFTIATLGHHQFNTNSSSRHLIVVKV